MVGFPSVGAHGSSRRCCLGVAVTLGLVMLATLDGASLVVVDRHRSPPPPRPASDGLPVPNVVHYIELSPPEAPWAASGRPTISRMLRRGLSEENGS